MGTISKALNLLNYFSGALPELSLVELTKLTGQDKATVHRHLVELEANGFLEQNSKSRKYRLGAALLRLSSIRERTFPARRIVSQWVDGLAAETGELVHASLVQHHGMSPLYFRDGSIGGTRVNFNEADVLPMHATASGLAALSFGVPALLKKNLSMDLKRFTAFTITDPDTLLSVVAQVKEDGFAYVDQTYESEVSSLAVPFFEDGMFACGAIAIAVPATRMNRISRGNFVQSLWKTSERISAELGSAIPEQLKTKWLAAFPSS